MIPITILITIILGVGTGAFKILVMYPVPSISHQRPIMALTERLVKDGHELFVISPNRVPGLENHSNYTYVDISFAYEYFADSNKDDALNLQAKISKWDALKTIIPMTNILRKEFQSEAFMQFKRRVESEEIKFDVVITETGFIHFTCGLTRLLSGNVPIISMSSLAKDWGEESLGSIPHPSFEPAIFSDYTDRMNLWQRLENWIFIFYMKTSIKIMEAEAKNFFRDSFGPGKESLVDGCLYNASLSIIASNSVYSYPRLLGPNVIEVGPLHLQPPSILPKTLQDWLDGAEKGVIYFSLGSNMKSKSLPEDVRTNFLKFFKELPVGYRVLWKWELDGKIPGQSDNILTQKWMPQASVLAHPKVKVFITQGGLQSFQEAMHYGKPTVGIPWFADQEGIVSKMIDVGIGVRLLPPDLHSFEKIKSALEAVLYDDSYLKNMKRLSSISKDFTSQALDKAVFWVEHVARHGGAFYLRPVTADTTLFQYFCLDIMAVILVLCLIILSLIFHFFKFLLFISTLRPTQKIKKI